STSVPTPLRTATSAPMPFAQNPSIFPSSSAFAASSPNDADSPMAPGTGPIFTSRSGSMPAAFSICFNPSTGRGAAHEIEPAFAQLLVGLGDGEKQLDGGVEAFLPEAAELHGCDRGEIRRRDEIRNGDAQAHCGLILAACTASFQSARSSRTARSNSAGVPQTGSTPIFSSRAAKAASLHPAAISRERRSTMDFGVADGATKPFQVTVRN